MERAHCSIECLCDGIDFDFYLTRQRFEGGCNKVYNEILQPIDDLLGDNNFKESDINQVKYFTQENFIISLENNFYSKLKK